MVGSEDDRALRWRALPHDIELQHRADVEV